MSKHSSRLVAGSTSAATNIEVGLVDAHHAVVDRAKAHTPTDGPDAVLDTSRPDGSLDDRPAAVGVGIPGVVHRGEVLTVPNLSDWTEKVEIGDELGDRLGVPIALGNDANVGLLGEHLAGAAQDVDDVLGWGWVPGSVAHWYSADGCTAEPAAPQGRSATSSCRNAARSAGCRPAGLRRGLRRAAADGDHRDGPAGGGPGHPAVRDPRDEVGKSSVTSEGVGEGARRGATPSPPNCSPQRSTHWACDRIDAQRARRRSRRDRGRAGGEAGSGSRRPHRVGGPAPWVLQSDPDRRFVVSALGDDAGIVGAARSRATSRLTPRVFRGSVAVAGRMISATR